MAVLYKDNYFIDVKDSKVQRIAELKADGWSEIAPDTAKPAEKAVVKPADEAKPAPKKGAKVEA